MAKLTLSVDPAIVSRAKRYAKERGLSVSEMVETYLSSLTQPSAAKDTPVLRRVRGILRQSRLADYKKHLATKYRE